MKHCKRILLLVVVMVILIAGLSCTAFASETGAEDGRIEGNNGEAVTLYPGLEFSTQSAKMIPSWAGWISEIDKNIFENAYFDESKKLLYLKVNEDLTSNTKTTFKLRGSWLRSKTITVYVNVGPKYLPNLTLLQGEARMATLPYGVKSVEIMEGSENVYVAKKGDSVLVKGNKKGTARVSVQYYADDIRNSIEAYEFKVSVLGQKAVDYSGAVKSLGAVKTFICHFPMQTLGFAPDTPIEVNGEKISVRYGCNCKHSGYSSTCFSIASNTPVGDVCEVTVPMDVWKGVNSDQKPEAILLHNSFVEGNTNGNTLKVHPNYRRLIGEEKLYEGSSGKAWIGYSNDDSKYIEVETPVMKGNAYVRTSDRDHSYKRYDDDIAKFYFVGFKDSAPDGCKVTIYAVGNGVAQKFALQKTSNRDECTPYSLGPDGKYNTFIGERNPVKTLRENSSLRYIFDPNMVAVIHNNYYADSALEPVHINSISIEGVKAGPTTVYESIDFSRDGAFGVAKAESNTVDERIDLSRDGAFWKIDINVTTKPIERYILPGERYSMAMDCYLFERDIESQIGKITSRDYLSIDVESYINGNRDVALKYDDSNKSVYVMMPDSVHRDNANVRVKFTNTKTGLSCVQEFRFIATKENGQF